MIMAFLVESAHVKLEVATKVILEITKPWKSSFLGSFSKEKKGGVLPKKLKFLW